jgi:hypothetical protein
VSWGVKGKTLREAGGNSGQREAGGVATASCEAGGVTSLGNARQTPRLTPSVDFRNPCHESHVAVFCEKRRSALWASSHGGKLRVDPLGVWEPRMMRM